MYTTNLINKIFWKKIVILGASGLLGSNLCLSLKNKYKIYPIINKKKLNLKNLRTKYLNLKKINEIEKYLKILIQIF